MSTEFPTSSSTPRAAYDDVDLWSSHGPTDMTVEQAIGLLEAVDQVPGATLQVLDVTLTDGPYDAESDDPSFAAQGAVELAYANLGLRPTKREPAGWLLTVTSIAAAFAVWQLVFFPLANAHVGGFWQMWFPLIVAGIVWAAVLAGISAISSRTWPHWLQAEQVRSGLRPANLAALGALAVSAIVTAVGLG